MEAIKEIEQQYRKPQVAKVQSGDTVRVHQLIREGNKQRVQVFEGVVIRTHRMNALTAVITMRRIASGIGVEKTFLLHSPNVQKVEIIRRAKVRRNFLSYLRGRRGKSARLQELGFDKAAANVAEDKPEEIKAEEAKAKDIKSDDEIDAELTELPLENSEMTEEPISTEVKEEEKAASQGDEPHQSDDPGEEGDEKAAPNDEVEAGLEKAETKDTHNQKST